MKISGWVVRFLASQVLPDLGAPMIRKFGFVSLGMTVRLPAESS